MASRASRTAEFMALFRALETVRRPRQARLFEDPLAHGFLGPGLRAVQLAACAPLVGGLVPRLIDRRWPGARSSGVARTRLIDDALRAAIEDGISQVVLLGAGFDGRAWRLPALEGARVFELDRPATLAAKRARLRGRAPRSRFHAFVETDFHAGAWPAALAQAGYRRGERAFFVWEGVTNYLTPEAVDEVLRWIGGSAGGSRLLFTYVHRGVLDGSEAFPGTERLFATLQRSQERWTFGLDPRELRACLAARGLELLEDLGAREYRERYLGPAGARERGYAFYRAALVAVSGGAPCRR